MQFEKNRRLIPGEKFSRAFNGLEFVAFDVDLDEARDHIKACRRIVNTLDPYLLRFWRSSHCVLEML